MRLFKQSEGRGGRREEERGEVPFKEVSESPAQGRENQDRIVLKMLRESIVCRSFREIN